MTAFIWRLAFAVAIMAVLRLAGSIGEGWERTCRAGDVLDVYPTDDEPEPYLPADQRRVEPGCCPMHDQARRNLRRQMQQVRVRSFTARRARIDWTPEVEAELARIADGGR